MFNAISRSQLFVLDQDEALDFYVGKLGLEVNTDQDLGFMRWLTVNVPGDPEHEILLEKPGPPALDPATAERVRELLTKGAMSGWLCLTTDDARKSLTHSLHREVSSQKTPNLLRGVTWVVSLNEMLWYSCSVKAWRLKSGSYVHFVASPAFRLLYMSMSCT